MDVSQNHFALFGLPERFALDMAALERARLAVQSQVHPDRFAGGSERDKRLAMQWAAQANTAYRTLRDPLARAAYLCGLRGAPVDGESQTAMPADFLQQQMQWRETLDEVRDAGDVRALHELQQQVEAERQRRLDAVARALDQRNEPAVAAAEVRALMFIQRFSDEVRRTAAALSDTASS